MSRPNGGQGRRQSGVKLPFALQKELGLENKAQGRRPRNGAIRNRKEQRRAGRLEKKRNKGTSRPKGRVQDDEDDEDEDEQFDERDEDPLPAPPAVKMTATKREPKKEEAKPKSILKKPKHRSPSPSISAEDDTDRSRSSSPGLVLDASSRAFRDRAAQDDAEISALERKLGVKKRARPKSFTEDGLDDLLQGLDEEERGQKKTNDEDDWLERKRRKTARQEEDDDEDLDIDEDDSAEDLDMDEDDLSDEDLEGGSTEDDLSDEDLEGGSTEDGQAEDDFESFESDENEKPQTRPAKVRAKVRENPYVAPVAANASGPKYVPPSLRKAQNSEGASVERLRRQLQGHLNKLSEANLISILDEIEKVYQSNPRQDVTSVLIELLLTQFSSKSTFQNTFVILHAAFLAAVYKVIGVDFGAELLSQLVDRFDLYHGDEAAGKEALNLISLLSNLFTFNVVSSAVIFDHIRLLLEELTENNTELLLRIVRDSGPQLRREDPSSLMAIVRSMAKTVDRMNAAGEKMSARTRVMMDMITDLKNNKLKTTSNVGLSSEHITQMRKALGSLNSRPLRASEPLRITRDDIKNSDKKGKWWLVGASWKGNESARATDGHTEATGALEDELERDNDGSVDLVALAREYGMNTDVRRSIFVALLSGVDYKDAHVRLMKLRLKQNQMQEIPRVLLRCAAGENPYNHYYTLVAKRLCLEKRMRKAFQFALWGFFRRLGENADIDDDANDDGDQNIEMNEIANLAKLYAHLVLDGGVTIGVLKVLDLAYIKERTSMFVELLLIMIIIEARNAKNDLLPRVFDRAIETPQVIKRLQYFVKKNVRNSDLIPKADKDTVKKGCKVALDTLSRLDSGANTMDD
ncbi:suppressor of glycerol defect [Rhinocladiella similis]